MTWVFVENKDPNFPLKDISLSEKIKIFSSPSVMEKVEELIDNGLTLKNFEISKVDQPFIPLSFYENFGFKLDELIYYLLTQSYYLDDVKRIAPIFEKIEQLILSEENHFEPMIIQKFLLKKTGVSIKTFQTIQERYDVWNQEDFSINLIYNTMFNLPDKIHYNFSISLVNNTISNLPDKIHHNFLDWLIDSDEFSFNKNYVLTYLLNFWYPSNFSLVEKLLKKGAVPKEKPLLISDTPTDSEQILNLLTDYIGPEKTWDFIKDNLKNERFRIEDFMVFFKWYRTHLGHKTFDDILIEEFS